MRAPLIVLKFGSSVLRSEQDLPRAVHEIYRWLRDGYRVVAVVSAIGKTTDSLLRQAEQYGDEPESAALAALVATGEATSVALLSLALDRAGIAAVPLDADRLGLRTKGRVLNADPVSLNVAEIRRVLDDYAVAVAPGFVGRMRDGRQSLLGRGGSDLTAFFLAQQLYAERCRLIKDVAGVFEHDPARGDHPRRYHSLSFDHAAHLGGRVVQAKALRFARRHQLRFEVGGLAVDPVTHVGAARTEFAAAEIPARPLKVGLLGCGTVGYGVYRELAAHPEWFDVTGIGVRNLDRGDQQVPRALLTRDPRAVIESGCDVVVELMGGTQPALDCILAALRAGQHVVTANKLVLAQQGSAIRQLARSGRARLLASAAVGGAVPVLEALARLASTSRVRSIEAVINGTCNFVLDELARGRSFDDAVALAQASGFAEADPSFDVDGVDAACKLALLAHAAFGIDLPLDAIARTGIANLDPRHVFDLNATGRAVRLVARLSETPDGARAAVEPVVLDGAHPLASVRREHNAVVIELHDSTRVLLRGKGAGRWPTTEAVFADLLTLFREQAQARHASAAPAERSA